MEETLLPTVLLQHALELGAHLAPGDPPEEQIAIGAGCLVAMTGGLLKLPSHNARALAATVDNVGQHRCGVALIKPSGTSAAIVTGKTPAETAETLKSLAAACLLAAEKLVSLAADPQRN